MFLQLHSIPSKKPNPKTIDINTRFQYSKAIQPGMKSFNEFAVFADEIAPRCAGRKVLMYCTGGIRCEKASIMLKQRGVADVYQLKGGIHRYLDQFPDGGLYG